MTRVNTVNVVKCRGRTTVMNEVVKLVATELEHGEETEFG